METEREGKKGREEEGRCMSGVAARMRRRKGVEEPASRWEPRRRKQDSRDGRPARSSALPGTSQSIPTSKIPWLVRWASPQYIRTYVQTLPRSPGGGDEARDPCHVTQRRIRVT